MEIQICPMRRREDSDGLCPRGETPDYWDVELRSVPDEDGEIHVIVEVENLPDTAAAEAIVDELLLKHGAHIPFETVWGEPDA